MSTHLTGTVGDRGFLFMPPLGGSHGGSVDVHESSSALAPRIWLTVTSPDGDDHSITLDVEVARLLAEQLVWLADHHYQLRGDEKVVR